MILDLNEIKLLYLSGLTTTEVAKKSGISVSTVRLHLFKSGCLRTPSEAQQLAASKGRLGSGLSGKKRPSFSRSWRQNISKAKLGVGAGVTTKKDGRVEYTMGKNKYKSAHTVLMEERIGRKLHKDECVHHIDRNKSNNNLNNLALVTTSGHARLHRFEDKLEGKNRTRNINGRFTNEWN